MSAVHSMHYREECVHGLDGAQCRCAKPDQLVRLVPCEKIWDHDRRRGTPLALPESVIRQAAERLP